MATAGLIATDVGSLGDLMQHNEDGWLAAALLTVGLSGASGSAAMAARSLKSAKMRSEIGEDEVRHLFRPTTKLDSGHFPGWPELNRM